MLDPTCRDIIDVLGALIQDAEAAIAALTFYDNGLTVEDAPLGELGNLMGQLKRVPKTFESYAKTIQPLKDLCRIRALNRNIEKYAKVKIMSDELKIAGLTFSQEECDEPCIRDLIEHGEFNRARSSLLELVKGDERWTRYVEENLEDTPHVISGLLDEYIVHRKNSDIFFEEDNPFLKDDIDALPGSWH